MSLSLSSIRDALEGGAPAVVATCSSDGIPNVSYLSDVQYIDERHLALSFQFFNKTRANVLANPFARLLVIHGGSAARWRLLVHYQRTETSGPLFEKMRARLAGIASQQGMTDVFRLRGADVYRVLSIDPIDCARLPLAPKPSWLAPLRRACARLARSADLDDLVDDLLDVVSREFEIPHAMLLLRDAALRRLHAVASLGYPNPGAGAEVEEGEGVIGVAAQVGTAIRINHALAGNAYARTVREQLERDGEPIGALIPLPGLASPGSQMAVPICDRAQVLGVLYVEHPQPMRFGYDLEDALAVLAELLGPLLRRFDAGEADDSGVTPCTAAQPTVPAAGRLRVRHDPRTDAVFINDEYVIRGVAGAILWKMLLEHAQRGRQEFSSRELRADPRLNLPELVDNLAARLILLQRRLQQRPCGVTLHKLGRGRLQLRVQQPLAFDTAEG